MALFFQPYQFLFCFVLLLSELPIVLFPREIIQLLFSPAFSFSFICVEYSNTQKSTTELAPLKPENPNPETTSPANIPHSPPNTMGCGMSRPSPSRYIDDDNYEQNVYCPSKCRPFGHHHDHYSEQPEHHLRRQDMMLSEDDDRATLAKLSRELDQREREHC